MLLNYKRFSVRSLLKKLMGEAWAAKYTWDVCYESELEGNELLPAPQYDPRPIREMLKAIVVVLIGSKHGVNL